MKRIDIHTIKYKKGNNDDIGKAEKERRKLETVNISNTGKNIQLCSVGQEVQMLTSIELVQ